MNVKIIKKHLKDDRIIDDDVFILQYKVKTLFGKEKYYQIYMTGINLIQILDCQKC